MKIFANKSIWKKIVIIFLLITSISFATPQPVHATVGGELMKPICDLLVGLGDGVIKVIHIGILGQDNTLLRVYEMGMGSFVSLALKAIAIAVLTISVIAAWTVIGPVLAGGISAVLASGGVATIVAGASTVVKGAIIAGVLYFASGAFSNQIVLPLYTISPEEIFRNKIPVFDVNFVNPNSNPINSKWVNEIKLDPLADGKKAIEEARTNNGEYRSRKEGETFPSVQEVKEKGTKYEGDEAKKYYNVSEGNQVFPYGSVVYVYKKDGKEYIVKSEPGNGYQGFKDSDVMIKVDKSSEKSANTGTNTSTADADENKIYGISYILQDTISKWYFNLRIIAIVGMMSVLVYIGIRITISSASEQKAKYKELLKDWLVGMVLLFSMHYIMNFSNVAVSKLTEVFNSVNPYQMVPIVEDNINGTSGKVLSILEEYDVPKEYDGKVLWATGEGENSKYVEWHTNLMGAIRMKAEARKEDGNDESFIGYSLMFVVMVIYTISFCWIYLRRVVYMAFLTLIAPLVALTYPIDKANDGHAQGFNYWFKEYIFNLLIQPVHLLIYTILVSSAAELAVKHWIYSLVVLGFLVTAEKILRKMFNFRAENAPGLMSGPIAAGLTMTGMRWLMGHGPKGDPNKGKMGEDSKSGIGGTNKTKMRELIGGNITESTTGEPNGAIDNVVTNNSNSEGVLPGIINGDNNEVENTTEGMAQLANNVINSGNTTRRNIENATPRNGRQNTRLISGVRNNSQSQNKGWKQGFSNMANRFMSNQKNKILQDAREGKSLRALGRGAVGAFSGATLGALGLAAGVASGDPSKAFQNAAIGAAGGYKLGSGTASNIAEEIDLQGLSEAYGRGAMGSEEYDARQAKKYAEEYSSRTEVIKKVQEEFGINSWEEAEKKAKTLANDYGVQEGFYDVKDWKKFEKMRDEMANNGRRASKKQAVAAKKVYDNFYDKTKSREEIEKAMRDSMGINNSQARIMTDVMYKWGNIIS